MEKIKFRGKIIKSYQSHYGIWAIGYLTKRHNRGKKEAYSIQMQNPFNKEKSIVIEVQKNTIGQLICKDKNGDEVWSNSKVKYSESIYSLKYSVNGWYIDDGFLSNFEETEIEVVEN